MILGTSAMMAILLEEPEFGSFTELVHGSAICLMSAANFVEVLLVMEARIGSSAKLECELFLKGAEIRVEPVTLAHALLAHRAFVEYGKGRHPAGLNFGDCCSYALAKATGQPLLLKGDDFSKTDVVAA